MVEVKMNMMTNGFQCDINNELERSVSPPLSCSMTNGCRMSPTSDKPIPLLFHDDQLASNHLLQLNTLRKSGDFCDVCLSVRGRHIMGHRVILAGSCLYLYERFSCDSITTSNNGSITGHHSNITFNVEIEDTNIDGESLEILVNYIYTARLEVDADMVKSVYRTANFMKIQGATEACSRYLADNLSPSNCLGIRTFANGNRDINLTTTTDTYISSHLADVLQSAERCSLPNVQIKIVGVQKNELDVDGSIPQLLHLVVQWVKSEYNSLIDENEFIDQVHMVYLTSDRNLKDCRLMNEKCTDTTEIKDYRSQMRQLHRYEVGGRQSRSSSTERREWKLIAFDMWTEKSCVCIAMLAGTLSVISLSLQSIDKEVKHSINKNEENEGQRLNVKKQYSLVPLSTMNSSRCGTGIVTIDNKTIVVMGGYNRRECLKTVECFNVKTNTWSFMTPMPHARGRFAATVIKTNEAHMIYVCGGSDGQSDLATCLAYNVQTEEWINIANMSMARSCPAITSLNGKLYVIGGWNGYNGVNSCEVYDPSTNVWSPIAPMRHERSQTTICILEGKIVVMGGSDAWDCTNTVEIYCTDTDQWRMLPSMSTSRRGAGSALFKGNLYAIGGSDGHMCLSSIEIFNTSTQSWSNGPQMSTARCNVGVAIACQSLYAIGGFSGREFLNDAEFIDDDDESCGWCQSLKVDQGHCNDDSGLSDGGSPSCEELRNLNTHSIS